MPRSPEIPYAQIAQLGEPLGEPLELQPPALGQYAGSLALLVLAAAAFGCSGWTLSQGDSEVAIGFAVLGLVCAAAAAFFLRRRQNRRATVTLYRHGVTCTRRRRTRAFLFQELRSLSLDESEELANGTPVGLRRRLRLRSSDARFHLLHVAPLDQPDLFGAWLDAAIDGFADAAERGLSGGRPLAGRGWTLTQTGLRTGSSQALFAELGAVGVVQHQVAVWRGDEEMPFFEIAAGSPNALVLARLLGRRIGERPATEEADAGIGRLVFAYRNRWPTIAVSALVGLTLMIPGAVLLLEDEPYLGAVILGLGLAVLVAAVGAARLRVRFHQNAVVQRRLFGRRTLPYSEVDGLAYRAAASYVQGAYAGTRVRIALRPRPPGKKMVIKATVQGTPEGFEGVRDGVASLIAGRLAELLTAAGEVEWVSSVWLNRDGLHYVDKRFWRRGADELLVDFRQEIAFDIQRDVFRLFLPPEKRPVLKIPCRRENFYPGFLLFQQLVWEAIEPGLEVGG